MTVLKQTKKCEGRSPEDFGFFFFFVRLKLAESAPNKTTKQINEQN